MKLKQSSWCLRPFSAVSLTLNLLGCIAFILLQQDEDASEGPKLPEVRLEIDNNLQPYIDKPHENVATDHPVLPTWGEFESIEISELRTILEGLSMPNWAIENLLVAKINHQFKKEIAQFSNSFQSTGMLSHQMNDQRIRFLSGCHELELERRTKVSEILGIAPEYVPGPDGSSFELERVAMSALLVGDIQPELIANYINLKSNLDTDLGYIRKIHLDLETPQFQKQKAVLEDRFGQSALKLLGNVTYEDFNAAATYLRLFDATSPERHFGCKVSDRELYRLMVVYSKKTSKEELNSDIKAVLGKDRYFLYMLREDPVFGRYSSQSSQLLPTPVQFAILNDLKNFYITEKGRGEVDSDVLTHSVNEAVFEALGESLYHYFINSKNSWLK